MTYKIFKLDRPTRLQKDEQNGTRYVLREVTGDFATFDQAARQACKLMGNHTILPVIKGKEDKW